MDIPAGLILDPPNLKPWQNVPVRDYVAKAFGLPTAFQHDANAAAFGEYWAGAGREANSLVFFTLGTGVGGGIIIDDYVLEGQHSHNARARTRVPIEMSQSAPSHGCGRMGCLEAYASATAVVKRTMEALTKSGARSPLRQQSKKEGGLSARDVFEAALAGDKLAETIVAETATYLAIGAVFAMHTIDPDMVVFGGGMIAAGDGFLDRIRKEVKRLALPVPAERTQIRFASLGSDAGYVGAAACGRQLYWKLRKKPRLEEIS